MRLLPAFSVYSLVLASTAVGHESTDSDNFDSILRRNAEIESQLADGPAQGVRKMTDDEGEKFFLEYWQFGEEQGGLPERNLGEANATSHTPNFDIAADQHDNNEEMGIDFSPARFLARSHALEPSFEAESRRRGRLLESRDFKCPTGTNACTSINRSDRCCSTGDTCIIVTNTGSGDVGCCPSGQTCSGTIGSCQVGYSTCSQALGGGCCIPGYECVQGGCAYISVVTVTIDSTVTISTVTHTTSQQTSDSTHSSSSSSTSSSSSSSSTSSSSSSSSSSSKSSLSKSTSTDSPTPPARGTSVTTATHSVTHQVSGCPTGFYACSAVYQGGCCQTGRNCDTTSCPTTSSTTFVSDGRTIVVPVTTESSGSSRTGGKCANGWFSCADTVGGGCCPSGYACGSSFCAATGTATTTVAKELATSNEAGVNGIGTMLIVSLVCLGWIL
ncbi:uncharacterized protein N7482_007486 [Penicillium canariense]|uniref:GPI anchored protein n=1 Tax=Penicillium canariense TaxID=189055 RepID=A0A9W9HZS4_9EURO|nr:uncharacterized protein N7482_007486 [Penicillium canariense]KAJ5160482.1 hypothetical protein N7482_007486 [Penicillium canariense]